MSERAAPPPPPYVNRFEVTGSVGRPDSILRLFYQPPGTDRETQEPYLVQEVLCDITLLRNMSEILGRHVDGQFKAMQAAAENAQSGEQRAVPVLVPFPIRAPEPPKPEGQE